MRYSWDVKPGPLAPGSVLLTTATCSGNCERRREGLQAGEVVGEKKIPR